ncbi:MAG: ribosome-associated GTPase EngA, partial [Acidobacteria bacterium]|nr:ribosome-associated GTPase EngA [Acidobacteriota bacterium]
VDGRSALAAPDLELARLLQRTGKRLILAVNKIDSPALEPHIEDFRRLGIAEVLPISAEHGGGVAELLDKLLEMVLTERGSEPLEPEATQMPGEEESPGGRVDRVAIIGRPNVGKSTLLNRITGTTRAIVSPVPGTTRDAVDELVEHNGHTIQLIDTAGIRRKGKTELMAEKLSVIMARKHLQACDVALLVLDASEGVTALDATIAGYAHEGGRSLVIVVNKWDLLSGAPGEVSEGNGMAGRGRAKGRLPREHARYEALVRDKLKFLAYAPVVFVSAASGRGMERLIAAIEQVAAERRKRISTGEMNRFLATIDFERAPVPAARRVRIYYMTQAAVSPPTFILFTDRNVRLHFSYERFLENQIRRAFGFAGSPIWIKTRARSRN